MHSKEKTGIGTYFTEQYINQCVQLEETGLSTKTDKLSLLHKKECAEMCDIVCSAEILPGKQNSAHYKPFKAHP